MDHIDVGALLGLPYLERADELWKLIEFNNWDQKTLAAILGVSRDVMSSYFSSRKLCDDARELIRSRTVDQRPAIKSVQLICRLTPELQREFVQTLPAELSEKKQVRWLRDAFARRHIVLSGRGPRRERRLRKEIEQLTLRIGTLSRRIARLGNKLAGMSETGRALALSLDESPQPSRLLRSDLEKLQVELQALLNFLENAIPESRPVFRQGQRIVVSYFDERFVELKPAAVSPAEYVRLWDEGRLSFQPKGDPTPDHLPNREEALKMY